MAMLNFQMVILNIDYTLVMTNIAVENGDLQWIYPLTLKMVIFHSHVSLPEGNICSPLNLQFWPIHMTIDFQLPGWLLYWADGNWEIGFGTVSQGCSCFCSHFSSTNWRIQWCLSRILMAYVRTHKYHQISMHVDAMLRKKMPAQSYSLAWPSTFSRE